MTGKAVFGHNLFSDLDPEEFQSKFLTGYRGPRHHNDGHHDAHHDKNTEQNISDGVAKSHSYFRDTTSEERTSPLATTSVTRHPSIQRKLEEHIAMYGAGTIGGGSSSFSSSRHGSNKYQYSSWQHKYFWGCQWWDVSCYLRKIMGYQYVGGTREPLFDGDSYPSALDWRAMGVVSDVHSQGACGACWAMTAVETIESAYAISTGTLIDLAEEEVIACDGSCEMCNGGWPQNAVSYFVCTMWLVTIFFYPCADHQMFLCFPFYSNENTV